MGLRRVEVLYRINKAIIVKTRLHLFIRFALLAGIFMVSNPVLAQPSNNCSVISPATACVGESVEFRASCDTYDGTFYWLIDGVEVTVGFTSFHHVFQTAGRHNVTLRILLYVDERGGQVWDTEASTIIDISASGGPPVIQASSLTTCSGGSVTLTVTNPGVGSYSWSSGPSGYSGTGTSVTFNNLQANTTFVVVNSGGNCVFQSQIEIGVEKTTITPVADAITDYHRRTIRGTGTAADHYWQVLADGTSQSLSLAEPRMITEPATFFIRRYIGGNINCWTAPSGPLVVTLSYVPPAAQTGSVLRAGGTDVFLTNVDRSFVLQYADYYWVSDDGGNPEILRPFVENGQIVNNRFTVAGTYYIRGKDRGTGAWGSTVSVVVSVRGDDDINSVRTRLFDGTSDEIPYAESKQYYGDDGALLQAQTKAHHNKNTFIFTSGQLRDRYDRVVGTTLPSPLATSDFLYDPGYVLRESGGAFVVPKLARGAVGWYYSSGNTLEEHVATTEYPYTRTEFYNDGTGEVRRSAGVGEALRMGSLHEVVSGTFPVYHELDDYVQKRSEAIPGTVVGSTFKMEGVQSVVRDQNGQYAISVTDKAGKSVMTARAGGEAVGEHVLAVANSVTSSGNPSSPDYRSMTYFYLLRDQAVTLTGSTDFVVEDILNDTRLAAGQTFAQNGGNWPAGFYRILLPNTTSTVTISYTHYFQDVSYQFYNDAERLVSSVSPNGFKAWKSGGAAYGVIDKTEYRYNYRGWLLSQREPDAGKTQYIYRNDGAIRFSQNSEQRKAGRFSYTHYDAQGRPVESGEYTGSSKVFVAMDSAAFVSSAIRGELEKAGHEQNWTSGSRKDWLETYYDYEDGGLSSLGLGAGYTQHNVRGAVSWTRNANIKTWYSYDELGRVQWLIQKPTLLPRVFVVAYAYDFLGNVQMVSSLAYEPGGEEPLDEFYHHYEYDVDKRLVAAYTSTKPNGPRKVRAGYSYYLHGPLKRVVLGDGMQGVDFVYNIHGWLTQINHPDPAQDPGGDGNDVFGMVLDYYTSDMAGVHTSAPVHDAGKRHGLPSGYRAIAADNVLATPLQPTAIQATSQRSEGRGISTFNQSATTPK